MIEDTSSMFVYGNDEGFDVAQAQHLDVLAKSLGIYMERTEVRGELWAEFDEHDSFHHMRSKVARIGVILQDGRYSDTQLIDDPPLINADSLRKTLLDEAYDLINYTAFLIRHITGEKPRVKKTDEDSPMGGTATPRTGEV